MEQSETTTNVPESEPLAETQTEEMPLLPASPPPETEEGGEREPIKTVNTFWERLDEVLNNLEETKDLSAAPARPFLNQPDRVFISSQDDESQVISQTDVQEQTFSQFSVELTKPLLNVKSIQLVSATIPQGGLSIPDEELVFWYYKGTKAQITNGTYFVASNLHYVRILPSYYKPELVYNYTATGYSEWVSTTTYANGAVITYNGKQYISIQSGNLNQNPVTQTAYWTYQTDVQLIARNTFAFNRSFSSYDDLDTVLALATAADPFYNYSTNQIQAWSATTTYYQKQFVTYLGNTYASLQSNNLNKNPATQTAYWFLLESTLFIPSFIPNDIQLTYDTVTGKFLMIAPAGTTSYYCAAGYNDTNVQNQSDFLQVLTTQSDFLTAMPAGYGQPYTIGRTLNLRLGFTWDGNNRTTDLNASIGSASFSLLNRFRPSPLTANFIRELWGGIDSIVIYTADAQPNMVLSNRILIFADFVGPSTTGSGSYENLLCSVANAGTLGVLNYMATFFNPLTKVAPEIYTIQVYLRTDTGVPYRLPNSAIVGIELAIQYF
jgi:hypothetical protein